MESEKIFITFQEELLKTYSQRKITKDIFLLCGNPFSTIHFLSKVFIIVNICSSGDFRYLKQQDLTLIRLF